MPQEERMESTISAPSEAYPEMTDQLYKELVLEGEFLREETLSAITQPLRDYEVLFYWQLLQKLKQASRSDDSAEHIQRIEAILTAADYEPWTAGSRNLVADRLASVASYEGWRHTGQLDQIFLAVGHLFRDRSRTS